MECAEVLQIVSRYLASKGVGTLEEPDLGGAVQHVSSCRRCVENLDILAVLAGVSRGELLQDQMAQHSPCWRCQEDLPAYIDQELYGGAGDELTQSVRLHLLTCEECSEDYRTITSLALAGIRGLTGETHRTAPQVWRLVEEQVWPGFKGQVKVLRSQIKAVLDSSGLTVTADPAELHPFPLLAASATKSAHRAPAPGDIERLIAVPPPDDEGNIQVNLMLKASSSRIASLTIEVVDVQTSSPVEAAQVALYSQNDENEMDLIHSTETDMDGEASFDLDQGQYELEVMHNQVVLRFPIGFQHE